MSDFVLKIKSALSGHSTRKKFLIGVSGGRDSMVLLHALIALGYRKLVVCHLDHGLRGPESRKDAGLVRRFARARGLPLEAARVNTRAISKSRGLSLELAARELRLDFFRACSRRQRCPRLFLAHHAEDQVETVVHNLLRGTGTAGLAGIRPVSKMGKLEIIRPLLEISRPEINAYAKDCAVPWREDASNRDENHTRNRLRRKVLPFLEKTMGAAFRPAILRTATILREEEAWMESLVPAPTLRLNTAWLATLPLALRRRLVRRWLLHHGIAGTGFQETERVLSLLDKESGPAKINLPGGNHARRRSGEIFFESRPG